jgi:chemotaxis protein histidine kinase CheA
MKIDLSQFRQTFLQESAEHVATMESGLLALRSNPDDEETLNAIFRAAHSIKGGAGSFGLASLVRFTHALENLLDRLRGAEIVASEEVIAALLEAVDVVRALLEANAGEQMPAEAIRLIACIEALTAPQMENRGGGETREDAGEPERRATEAEQEMQTQRLWRFTASTSGPIARCFQAGPIRSYCCATWLLSAGSASANCTLRNCLRWPRSILASPI